MYLVGCIEFSSWVILIQVSIAYLSALRSSICQPRCMPHETVAYESQQRQNTTNGIQQSLMQLIALSDGGQYAVHSPGKLSHSVEHTLQQLKSIQIIWHDDWRVVCVNRRWRPELRLVVVILSCWMHMDDDDQSSRMTFIISLRTGFWPNHNLTLVNS